MKKVVLLVIMSCLGLMAWASVPETRIFNVVDGDTLKMDIYRTPSDNKTLRPAVIFAFGGGFTGGSRDNDEYKEYFDFLCDNEVVVISIDYRTSLVKKAAPGALTSVDGFTASLMTAVTDAVTDFCTATGFVLQHAVEWGIDPDKIVASGSSAGAITALQAEYSLANGQIPAGVFPANFNYAAVVSFAGAICCEGTPVWTSVPCPMMLFHGDADRNVPYETLSAGAMGLCGSKTIASGLASCKVPCEFYTFLGADHSIAVSPMHDDLYTILGFIRRVCDGQQSTALDAVRFVPGASDDYQKNFSISDYIKANL